MKYNGRIFSQFLVSLLFLLFSCVDRKAEVKFPFESYSFGEISIQDSIYHAFPIVNAGNLPLIIKNANGSCDCISITWTEREILPGDTGYVNLHYQAKALGMNKKTVVIETNAEDPFSSFTFQADVID